MKEVKIFSEWLKTLNDEDIDFLVRLETKEKIIFNLETMNKVFFIDGQFLTLEFSKEEGYTIYMNDCEQDIHIRVVDKEGKVLEA